MRGGSIAKRYVTALLSLAKAENKVEAIEQELSQLNQAMAQSSELRTTLETPLIRPELKKQSWLKVAEKLQIGPLLRNLVLTLIDQKRINLLPLMTLLYRDMADEQLGQVRVQITSTVPLGAYQPRLEAALAKSLQRKVLLNVKVDPTLLGGFIVHVQDKIFDASLRNDLRRLQETIAKRAVA